MCVWYACVRSFVCALMCMCLWLLWVWCVCMCVLLSEGVYVCVWVHSWVQVCTCIGYVYVCGPECRCVHGCVVTLGVYVYVCVRSWVQVCTCVCSWVQVYTCVCVVALGVYECAPECRCVHGCMVALGVYVCVCVHSWLQVHVCSPECRCAHVCMVALGVYVHVCDVCACGGGGYVFPWSQSQASVSLYSFIHPGKTSLSSENLLFQLVRLAGLLLGSSERLSHPEIIVGCHTHPTFLWVPRTWPLSLHLLANTPPTVIYPASRLLKLRIHKEPSFFVVWIASREQGTVAKKVNSTGFRLCFSPSWGLGPCPVASVIRLWPATAHLLSLW